MIRYERDDARGAYLCRVGQDVVLSAEVLVDPDGQEMFIVQRYDPDQTDHTFRLRPPDHERIGPLPREIQRRIWGTSTFCNRPNRSGKPCRSTVDRPGEPCRWHVGAEPMTTRRAVA